MGVLTTIKQTAQEQSDAFDVTMPKDPGLVAAMRLTAAAIGHHTGFSIDAIDDLKIVVAEACSYCIQHAGSGRLRISFVPGIGSLMVIVEDAELTRPPLVRAPGEFLESDDGLFIIKNLADNVDYEIDPERGLRLTIRMRA
jgi:serine/threonine-protein kinase RsbW